MTKQAKQESIRNIPPFGLRMQPDLKDKLQETAKSRGISLNELITSTLERTYRSQDPSGVFILDIPPYLRTALDLFTAFDSKPVDDAIIDILREKFPDALGIEAISSAEGEAYHVFEDGLEEGTVVTKEDKVRMRVALLNLTDMYRLHFKQSK